MSKKNKKNRKKKISVEFSISLYFIRFKITVEWL